MDSYERLLRKTLQNDRKCYGWLMAKDFTFYKMKEESENSRKRGNDLYLQEHHTADVHREVFKHYCESVMFAPLDSEPLALALGNRSAFLLHVQKYEESIRDIDKAVKITKSNQLKAKLLCRKIECSKRLGSSDYQQDIDEIDGCIDKIEDNKAKKRLMKKLKKVQAYPIIKEAKSTRESDTNSIKCLPKINNILDQIEMRHSDKYGRYTVAAKDYKPGDVIFIEDLYNTTIEPSRTCISCHYCCKTAWAGIPCDECSWAIFCSEGCKEKAWKEFHDIECTVMPYMRLHMDTITSDTSLRLLVLGLRECGSVKQLREELQSVDVCTDAVGKGFYKDGKLSTDTIRSIYSLKGDGLSDDVVKSIAQAIPSILIGLVKCRNFPKNHTVKKFKDLLKNDDLMFLGALLIKFTVIYSLNAFGYYSYYKCEISEDSEACEENDCCRRAGAVAPFASLLNHSCFPNASRFFTDDRKIVVYALHPIKKNSQIFITYYSMFFYHPIDERQEVLCNNYAFQCDCQPCLEAWPTILDEEYNFIVIGSPEEAIFKSCENIISQIHDLTVTVRYDKGIVKQLSTAISKAFERLKQPSHLTCSLIKSLIMYYGRTLGLQPVSFGDCEKFSKQIPVFSEW